MINKDEKYEELYNYLNSQCEGVLNFELINLSNRDRMIVVTSDDKEVNIEISCNDDMFLYGDEQSSELIDKLVPVINIYRNGKTPSFEYNTYNIEQGEIIDKTIEWSINPEERLKDLKLNSNYPYFVKNLSVLFESKEERDKRLGFTDFSSCFFPNSSLDNFDEFISMVDQYNEQDCFLVLNTLGAVNSCGMNRVWKGYLPDLAIVSDAADVVLNKVSMLLGDTCDDLYSFLKTEQYSNWINKWKEYFTYERKCEYMEAKLNNEDVSMFVPEKVQSLKKKTGKNI